MRDFLLPFALFALLSLPSTEAQAFREPVAAKEPVNLGRRQTVTKNYTLSKDAYITVKVVESGGNKIAVRVENNGVQVFFTEDKGTLRGRFPAKKGSLHVILINKNVVKEKKLIISVTAWGSMDFLNKFRKSRDLTLAKDERAQIEPRGRVARLYNLTQSGYLIVDVREAEGKKVGFEIVNNGRNIFKSSEQPGQVSGRIKVSKGTVTVEIVNKHVFKKKSVTFSVSLE